MKRLPASLFGRWIHAHEEDASGIEAYRPAGTPLPPARGRRGFEIRRDGTFVRIRPGGTDVSQRDEGTWEETAPGTLRVTYADGGTETLRVVQARGDLLKIAR